MTDAPPPRTARVLSATGMLGTGFLEASLERGIEMGALADLSALPLQKITGIRLPKVEELVD